MSNDSRPHGEQRRNHSPSSSRADSRWRLTLARDIGELHRRGCVLSGELPVEARAGSRRALELDGVRRAGIGRRATVAWSARVGAARVHDGSSLLLLFGVATELARIAERILSGQSAVPRDSNRSNKAVAMMVAGTPSSMVASTSTVLRRS